MNRFSSPRPLSMPAQHDMFTCFRDGQRVLLHRDEVARLMREQKEEQKRAARGERYVAPTVHSSPALPAHEEMLKSGNDEIKAGPSHDEQIIKPVYTISPKHENESWQMLARLSLNAVKYWRECHKPRCRRGRQCAGGKDACFVRYYDVVEEHMQRTIMPRLREMRMRGELSGEEQPQMAAGPKAGRHGSRDVRGSTDCYDRSRDPRG